MCFLNENLYTIRSKIVYKFLFANSIYKYQILKYVVPPAFSYTHKNLTTCQQDVFATGL
jgi:hypothetical protein